MIITIQKVENGFTVTTNNGSVTKTQIAQSDRKAISIAREALAELNPQEPKKGEKAPKNKEKGSKKKEEKVSKKKAK